MEKGRNLIIIICCVLISDTLLYLLGSLSSIYISIIEYQDFSDLLVVIFRVALIFSLCYEVFKAYDWARWVLAILVLISGLVNIVRIVAMQNLVAGIISFIYGTVYGISGVMLLTSKSIKEYIIYKNVQKKLSN